MNHGSQKVPSQRPREAQWLRESATVRATLEGHGVRDSLVISLQKRQAKVFAPGLGMFVVSVECVAPAPNPSLLAWDRKVVEALVPALGSLVNVRLEGEKSLVQARLESDLEGVSDAETVQLSRGVLGRKSERLQVPRSCIVGRTSLPKSSR